MYCRCRCIIDDVVRYWIPANRDVVLVLREDVCAQHPRFVFVGSAAGPFNVINRGVSERHDMRSCVPARSNGVYKLPPHCWYGSDSSVQQGGAARGVGKGAMEVPMCLTCNAAGTSFSQFVLISTIRLKGAATQRTHEQARVHAAGCARLVVTCGNTSRRGSSVQ